MNNLEVHVAYWRKEAVRARYIFFAFLTAAWIFCVIGVGIDASPLVWGIVFALNIASSAMAGRCAGAEFSAIENRVMTMAILNGKYQVFTEAYLPQVKNKKLFAQLLQEHEALHGNKLWQ